MNILITSVGRRSYLVDYFKKALSGSGRVVCANMFEHAAGMYAADVAIVTPPSCDPEYIPFVVGICHKHDIGLIFSFHDLDVYILSQHADELRKAGAFPVLPRPEWGRIALDKYECTRLLSDNGFDVPWTTLDVQGALAAVAAGRIRFPLIVKARMGFGSQGLCLSNNQDELLEAYRQARKLIEETGTSSYVPCHADQGVLIQQAISGKEYCVDVVNDLEGNFSCSFMLEVHAMRAGETDMITTVDPSIAGDLPLRFSRLTRHLGIWGVDCLDDNGTLRVIDVNPRFTGDYPFHQITGANIPAALVAWANKEDPDPSWLSARTGVRAYKDLVPKCV
ncbi:MAG: ATP-grasp domain-containing protein [Smithella sp.]|nr:ATP-grasp domain-containing protein [Smithella sp.]